MTWARSASEQGHADCQFPCDCGRYVEIWNLVFMQFDRDLQGKLSPLPKPSIDTGMGLERVTAVLQGVISNYETDLFMPLIKRAAELTGTSLTKELEKEAKAKSAASLRVIADHSRAATFLISDGVLPSNEGRGYVLRKIIRRAITHGRLLGQTKPFLYEMVFAVRDLMQDAYPELRDRPTACRKPCILRKTGSRTRWTSDWESWRSYSGIPRTNFSARGFQALRHLRHATRLYAGCGARSGLPFDQAGFDHAMAEQKSRARASWKGGAKQTANPAYQQLPKSVFEGYRQTRSDGCEVLAIIHNGQGARELKAGESGEMILDHTPFYAESAGRWATGDGFIPTITIPWLLRLRDVIRRFRECGRIRWSRNGRCASGTRSMLS